MKLAVTDGYALNPGDLSWDQLKKFGDLTVYEHLPETEDELIERLRDKDIVLPNKSGISRRVIDACPNLKLIAVLATGYNVIDYKYAAEKGIPVCNVPSYGTMSVAQYAISMLLEITGRVAHHNAAVHSGEWARRGEFCFWDYPLIELDGKTLGIIGFGRIGQQTARIAKAMGMNILAFNRSRNAAGEAIGTYVTLDELLAKSDVISLHCPLFPETEGIINKDTIAKMKDGVIILNNSRGPLVVEQDLADALRSGKVAAAAVDVVSEEPITEDNPLFTAPNCIITPHISWAPIESRQRIIDCAEANIAAFLAGKPQNVVNTK